MCDWKQAGVSRQRKRKQARGIQPGGGARAEQMGAVTRGRDARRAGGQLMWTLETPGKSLAVSKERGEAVRCL